MLLMVTYFFLSENVLRHKLDILLIYLIKKQIFIDVPCLLKKYTSLD
jgi:hypothetical protein